MSPLGIASGTSGTVVGAQALRSIAHNGLFTRSSRRCRPPAFIVESAYGRIGGRTACFVRGADIDAIGLDITASSGTTGRADCAAFGEVAGTACSVDDLEIGVAAVEGREGIHGLRRYEGEQENCSAKKKAALCDG
ncbi:hypothetical protein K402DRAFT_388928 [Aulographum hederae CBS 113979]|uniref:Uncharacterized protein n=1 Tax=Aulographum hederae CBS 113979 TaxID=1176131 RepID=A0A6G1HE60_9PEZI|nr:hypothetical protein K402DRAFT_388928 [Aulographum hederae CBS 113979]